MCEEQEAKNFWRAQESGQEPDGHYNRPLETHREERTCKKGNHLTNAPSSRAYKDSYKGRNLNES